MNLDLISLLGHEELQPRYNVAHLAQGSTFGTKALFASFVQSIAGSTFFVQGKARGASTYWQEKIRRCGELIGFY